MRSLPKRLDGQILGHLVGRVKRLIVGIGDIASDGGQLAPIAQNAIQGCVKARAQVALQIRICNLAQRAKESVVCAGQLSLSCFVAESAANAGRLAKHAANDGQCLVGSRNSSLLEG